MIAAARHPGTIAAVIAIAMIGPAAAHAAPGDLDPSFGRFGKATLEIDPYAQSTANDVVTQPDGSTVVVGSIGTYEGAAATAWRVLPDGVPDPSFGNGGIVQPQTGDTKPASSVALRPDGRIVLSTWAGGSYPAELIVVQLLPDGSPDPSFGTGGVARTGIEIQPFPDRIDLTLASDGTIAIATNASGGLGLVARLLPNGEPDPLFSSDGFRTIQIGADRGGLKGVAVMPDGRIVAGGIGQRANARFDSFAVVRLTDAGELDPSFSGDGVELVDFGRPAGLNDVALQPDGRVVGVGSVSARRGTRPTVARFTTSGVLDDSFSRNGVAQLAARYNSHFSGVVVDGKHRIVASGNTGSSGAASGNALLARYRPGGRPDRSFSGDGRTVIDLGGNGDGFHTAVGLQADGKILLAGDRTEIGFRSSYTTARLARFLVAKGPHDADADGHLDRRDTCVETPATRHHGCPFFSRTVTAHYDGGAFVGVLRATRRRCGRKVPVRAFRVEPGRDRPVGPRSKTGVSAPFDYEIFSHNPSGRYYVRAPARVIPFMGLCAAARSRILEIR